MAPLPLITALCKLLSCEPKNLAEYLNNPIAINKAEEYIKGKKLFTTYLNKNGIKKEVKFGAISFKPVSEIFAFEGYLGKYLFYL